MPRRRLLKVDGLGVFERVLLPARLAADGMNIEPPCPALMFEHDDDAVGEEIALSIARAERVDTVHAREIIVRDVAEIRDGICLNGSYVLPGIGSLMATSTGGISFEQERNFTDNLGYGCLPAMSLKPLVAEAEAPAVDSISHAMGHRPRGLRMAARAAAAVVGFAVVVALVGIINRFSGMTAGDANQASMTVEAATPVADIANVGVAGAPLVLIMNTPADGASEARRRPVPMPDPVGDGPYCLVVASLASRSDADAFAAQYSSTDTPLAVLDNDGRYRVYAASGNGAAEVTSKAREAGLYDIFPSAWVCRR